MKRRQGGMKEDRTDICGAQATWTHMHHLIKAPNQSAR